MDVYGTNTRIEHVNLGDFEAGDVLEIDFAVTCALSRQDYTLTIATQYGDGSSQDWLDDAVQFTVVDSKDIAGVVDLRPEIHWRKSHGEIAAAECAPTQALHGNQR